MTVPLTSSLIGLLLNDRFRVEEKVGEELLGSLFVAIDEHPDQHRRRVLVKVLHPHLAANREKFARFGREITATEMVRHPNTVEVVGWGQHLELRYLVLEHLIAHPLAAELERGAMPPERAAHIAAQVAAAVGAAHQEGVVHRNLSPHNVLLLENAASGDFVKVRDFGLSKLERSDLDEGEGTLTQAGARVGNTQYMAPEYVEAGTVHPKGDLYAVGALFFHMVCGRPPYEGRAAEVLTAHVADPVPRPTLVDPSLPAWCDDVVEQLMAKRPRERPGGYQVVQLLEGHVGHSLGPPELLDVQDGEVVRPSRTGAVAIGLLGGVALLAALALVGILGVGAVGWGVYTLASSTPPPEGLEPVAAPTPERPVATPSEPPSPEEAPTRSAPVPAQAPAPEAAPAPSPRPTPSEATVGRVEVTANHRALVYVDDAVRGYTPVVLSETPGEHTIRVVIPGQADSEQQRAVRFTEQTQEHVQIRFP